MTGYRDADTDADGREDYTRRVRAIARANEHAGRFNAEAWAPGDTIPDYVADFLPVGTGRDGLEPDDVRRAWEDWRDEWATGDVLETNVRLNVDTGQVSEVEFVTGTGGPHDTLVIRTDGYAPGAGRFHCHGWGHAGAADYDVADLGAHPALDAAELIADTIATALLIGDIVAGDAGLYDAVRRAPGGRRHAYGA